MTQPIQEPNNERALQGIAYARDQLFRRPAPQPGNTTTSAYLDDFTANGTGALIANDTWEDISTGVDLPNSRWFNEFNYDPDNDWFTSDFANIDNAAPLAYLYSAYGHVDYDVPDGTLVGAQILWNPPEGVMNTAVMVNGLGRVMVYSERVPLGLSGVTLRGYQASGGAVEILSARLHVRRFELYEDVYVQEFAT